MENPELQRLDLPLFEASRLECWIKRDDKIHPFVSGNKLRKLYPILEEAIKRKVKSVTSYGGAYSNHLLALACLGAQLGINTKGIVRGEPVKNHVLQLCKLWGMQLEFLDRESYRNQRKVDQLFWDDATLIIPEGANCAEAIEGASEFWQELDGQSFDYVIDTVGSGSSVKGLLKAIPEDTTIEAIMCVNDDSLGKDLSELGATVHSGYSLGGFAKFSDELIAQCRSFSSQTGILLDPIYTGKLWMALSDLVDRDYFDKGSRILMVHSGGLTGWLSDTLMEKV